jgi:hypothetical protein
VTAQNLLLLSYIFANMASAYALVWDVARHRRGAILGGVIFGLSPYLASHLLGHFDLIAAWVLPLFALMVRRQMASASNRWAIGAGLVFAATAYTAYYYVVYLAFFLAVYLIAWLGWTPVRWSSADADAGGAPDAWRAGRVDDPAGGHRTLDRGDRRSNPDAGHDHRVGPHAAECPDGIWLCAIACAFCLWRPTLTRKPVPVDSRPARRRDRIVDCGGVHRRSRALLWQAAQLVTRGEYVTPAYQWRSAPRGVDLIAPLLGPP